MTRDDGERPMYCSRCDDSVPVIRPWAGWKPALYAWYGAMALMVLLFPFMASDFCVLIPTMMMITVAGSPLHRLAGEKPVCAHCSAELDPKRKAGSAVRPRATG